MRTRKKIRTIHLLHWIMTAVLCLNLVFACTIPAYADVTAQESMRLSKIEGTVQVLDHKDKNLSAVASMKLLNGYQVRTGAASYAWLTLDDTKAVKLDQASSVEIVQSGKKLELKVKSGNVLVNVDQPLEQDETLNIRTSSMVTGIRGTSVVIRVIDPEHSQIQLYDGKAEISVADPVSGQTKTAEITSGTTADTYIYPPEKADTQVTSVQPEKAGDKCGIETTAVTEQTISGFAAAEMETNPAMRERIEAQTDLNVQQITAEAAAKVQEEQTAVAEKLKEIEAQTAEQARTAAEQAQIQSNVLSVFAAQEAEAERTEQDSGSEQYSGSSESGNGGSSEETTAPVKKDEITLKVSVSAAEVQKALDRYTKVTLAGSGSFTIKAEEKLTIPEGKTLSVSSGISITVAHGQSATAFSEDNGTLLNYGTLEAADPNGIINRGCISNVGTISGKVLNYAFLKNGVDDSQGHSGLGEISEVEVLQESGCNYGPLFDTDGGMIDTLILEFSKAAMVDGCPVSGSLLSGGDVDKLILSGGSGADDPYELNEINVGTLTVANDTTGTHILSGTVKNLDISISPEQLKEIDFYQNATMGSISTDDLNKYSEKLCFEILQSSWKQLSSNQFWRFDSEGNFDRSCLGQAFEDYIKNNSAYSGRIVLNGINYDTYNLGNDDFNNLNLVADPSLEIDLNGATLSFMGSDVYISNVKFTGQKYYRNEQEKPGKVIFGAPVAALKDSIFSGSVNVDFKGAVNGDSSNDNIGLDGCTFSGSGTTTFYGSVAALQNCIFSGPGDVNFNKEVKNGIYGGTISGGTLTFASTANFIGVTFGGAFTLNFTDKNPHTFTDCDVDGSCKITINGDTKTITNKADLEAFLNNHFGTSLTALSLMELPEDATPSDAERTDTALTGLSGDAEVGGDSLIPDNAEEASPSDATPADAASKKDAGTAEGTKATATDTSGEKTDENGGNSGSTLPVGPLAPANIQEEEPAAKKSSGDDLNGGEA